MAETGLGKLEPVLNLIDDKFGPIKSLVGIRHGGKNPLWWVFHAQLSRPLGLYFVDFECDAWGSSINKNEALFKCLGESLERYCMYSASVKDRMEVLPASQCSFLGELPRCAPEESCHSGYKKIDPAWNLTQVQTTEVSTGHKHWMPAGYAHFTFHRHDAEMPITLPHSSGFAFHETLHQAIWSGLCEVAERDAFSLFWLNQLPAAEILLDKIDSSPEFHDLLLRVDSLARAGIEVRCFDITTEFQVPTVFALAMGQQYPLATFAAACGDDPVKTISKALDEIMLVRTAQIHGEDSAEVVSYSDFKWVSTLRHHSDLYALWKETPAFDFFLNDKSEKIEVSEFLQRQWWTAPDSFAALQKRCSMLQEELNMTVLYSDFTLDDIAHFGFGVKVTVPQMQPISVVESVKWLAHRRLSDHAERHSLQRASNPYPHPFP